MLKKYIIDGKTWQFEEGKQPAGAVEKGRKIPVPAKAAEPENKEAPKPANKARKAANK